MNAATGATFTGGGSVTVTSSLAILSRAIVIGHRQRHRVRAGGGIGMTRRRTTGRGVPVTEVPRPTRHRPISISRRRTHPHPPTTPSPRRREPRHRRHIHRRRIGHRHLFTALTSHHRHQSPSTSPCNASSGISMTRRRTHSRRVPVTKVPRPTRHRPIRIRRARRIKHHIQIGHRRRKTAVGGTSGDVAPGGPALRLSSAMVTGVAAVLER